MSSIKIVKVVFCIIPCTVNLIPFPIQFHGIPGMSIIGISYLDILYPGNCKKLRICTFIGLTGAKFSCQSTFC